MDKAIEYIKALVRPTIAIVLTIAVFYGFMKGFINTETMSGIYGMVVGFYFGSRDANKQTGIQ